MEARASVALRDLELEPIDDPVDTLLETLAELRAASSWLAAYAADHEGDHDAQAAWLDRLTDTARIAARVVALGIGERRARIDELATSAIAAAISHALASYCPPAVVGEARQAAADLLRAIDAAGEGDERDRLIHGALNATSRVATPAPPSGIAPGLVVAAPGGKGNGHADDNESHTVRTPDVRPPPLLDRDWQYFEW